MRVGSRQRCIRIKTLTALIMEELKRRRKGTSVAEIIVFPFSPVDYPRLTKNRRKPNE